MPFNIFVFFIPSMIFFFRFLLQYTRCDYYHPICKYTVIITNPFLKIVGNINKGNINYSSLIMSLLFSLIALFSLFEGNPLSVGLVTLLKLIVLSTCLYVWSIFHLFWFLLIIAAILSWIPQAENYSIIFRRLVSPIVNPLDKIIPPIGFISLSYLIAFIILQLIDNYAMIVVSKFFFRIIF